MNIVELFDMLAVTTGDEWCAIGDTLIDAGYRWQWIFHSDGTDNFVLVDA